MRVVLRWLCFERGNRAVPHRPQNILPPARGIALFVFRKIVLSLTDAFPLDIAMLLSGFWCENIDDFVSNSLCLLIRNKKFVPSRMFDGACLSTSFSCRRWRIPRRRTRAPLPSSSSRTSSATTRISSSSSTGGSDSASGSRYAPVRLVVCIAFFFFLFWFIFGLYLQDRLKNVFTCNCCPMPPPPQPDESDDLDERGHSNNRLGYFRRQVCVFYINIYLIISI